VLGEIFTSVGEKIDKDEKPSDDERDSYIIFLNSCIRGSEMRRMLDKELASDRVIAQELLLFPPYWNIAENYLRDRKKHITEDDRFTLAVMLMQSIAFLENEENVKAWGNENHQLVKNNFLSFNNYLVLIFKNTINIKDYTKNQS
jgi:hypothetical protein